MKDSSHSVSSLSSSPLREVKQKQGSIKLAPIGNGGKARLNSKNTKIKEEEELMKMKSQFKWSFSVPRPAAWVGAHWPSPESPGWALLSEHLLKKQAGEWAGEWAWEFTPGLGMMEYGPLSTQGPYNGQSQPGWWMCLPFGKHMGTLMRNIWQEVVDL